MKAKSRGLPVKKISNETFPRIFVEDFGLTEESIGDELEKNEGGPEEVDQPPNTKGVSGGSD